jgi:uncharacterized membrane protein
MRIKTGLKTMIGLAAAGIAVAILLVFTCPFAGVISFNTLVREGTASYAELTVHATAIPGVRNLPAKQASVFGSEVSFLGILVLLGVIALCVAILKGRRVSVFGYPITPQFMGLAVLLVTIWNVVFSAFLIAIEVLVLKEI